MKKITLISSAQLAYNPRLVKEADALHAAGFAVRVVAMDMDAARAQLDQSLMARRGWQLEVVTARRNGAGHGVWCRAALRQKLSSMLVRGVNTGGLQTRAYSRFAPELARLAAREPADLFIAHNLPALPAAAQAARRWQAKLGFDAEDFHRGEFSDSPENHEIIRLTRLLEEKYLPQCAYLTAASDGIAEAYAACIPVKQPLTILNVFPLTERTGHTPKAELAAERVKGGVSLYWYSQTIGPDRGLEDVLQALAQLDARVQMTVRGCWAAGYEEQFFALARKFGVAERVRVLPPAPPEQLIERAAQHDVGLALETGEVENRQLCVTNKIFSYLLAGLAVAATETPGQRGIMAGIPDAGFLYVTGAANSLANHLRYWLEHPAALRAAQEKAWSLGTTRYNWDLEKEKLVAAVKNVLNV